MAVLTVRELYDLLNQVRQEQPGVRMIYDGRNLTLTHVDRHDDVLAHAPVDGVREAVWDLTAYSASLDTVRAWLRMHMQKDGAQKVGISPFWYGGDHRVVFTGCGQQLAFPVIDLPTAPRS